MYLSWTLLSPELKVFILSMLPIAEVRLGIPLALTVYNLSILEAMFYGILGNSVAAIIVFLCLRARGDWIIHRIPYFGKWLEKYLSRARRLFVGKYEKWGVFGLIIFIGIPLPMTGAWTGAAVAYVFGFSKKKSIYAIIAGVCLASIIMVIATIGVSWIISFVGSW